MRLPRPGAAEDGQTLLLGIGMVTVVLALLLVVASATSIYLDVKKLTSWADSAAAAAAQAVDDPSYYSAAGTGGAAGSLTSASVLAAAGDDLSRQPDLLDGTQITSASTPDGLTAVVTLTARSRPPFLPWGIIPSEGFTITATGSARVSTTP